MEVIKINKRHLASFTGWSVPNGSFKVTHLPIILALHSLHVAVERVLRQTLSRVRVAELFEGGFEQDVADGSQPSKRVEKWHHGLVTNLSVASVLGGVDEHIHVCPKCNVDCILGNHTRRRPRSQASTLL